MVVNRAGGAGWCAPRLLASLGTEQLEQARWCREAVLNRMSPKTHCAGGPAVCAGQRVRAGCPPLPGRPRVWPAGWGDGACRQPRAVAAVCAGQRG